jgi:hypothetical protein
VAADLRFKVGRSEGPIMKQVIRPSRRAFVAAVALLPFALTRAAHADADGAVAPPRPGTRVVRVATDAYGTTVTLELEHAPFPAAGFAHRDPTVIAFIPRHHRPSRDGGVSVVVHFHGHNSSAERALLKHELREQLHESKQNAILVVPELAVLAPDSSAGKLEMPGGFGRLLQDVLRTLAGPDNLGHGRIGRAKVNPDDSDGRLHRGGDCAGTQCGKHV